MTIDDHQALYVALYEAINSGDPDRQNTAVKAAQDIVGADTVAEWRNEISYSSELSRAARHLPQVLAVADISLRDACDALATMIDRGLTTDAAVTDVEDLRHHLTAARRHLRAAMRVRADIAHATGYDE